MKYNQPYGEVDPNAPYVDRNTPGATAGSRVPAKAIEHTQREIVNFITQAGLTPSEGDLGQLWAAFLARTATEARIGLVELATIAETTARTDATRAVTPAGLGPLVAAAAGRLINIQTFITSGTYTPTPGMTFCIVEGVGGGAAGGGATAPNSGLVSLGAPGTAGTWGRGRYTAAQIGASRAVTIGAAGQGAPAAAGGSGGDTLLASLLQLPGGRGGGVLNAQSPPTVNGNGLVSGNATGANIASRSGTAPGPSIGFSGSSGIGAAGGDSPLGAGGYGITANANGTAANGNGAGGSGVCLIVGGGTAQGGSGSPGLLFILEYGT